MRMCTVDLDGVYMSMNKWMLTCFSLTGHSWMLRALVTALACSSSNFSFSASGRTVWDGQFLDGKRRLFSANLLAKEYLKNCSGPLTRRTLSSWSPWGWRSWPGPLGSPSLLAHPPPSENKLVVKSKKFVFNNFKQRKHETWSIRMDPGPNWLLWCVIPFHEQWTGVIKAVPSPTPDYPHTIILTQGQHESSKVLLFTGTLEWVSSVHSGKWVTG